MSRQLVFDLGARPALGREDFFVSDANALAVSMVEAPATWPQGKLLLVGAPGSGKSHLARIWAQDHGAMALDATALPDSPQDGPHVVEDIDDLAGDPNREERLFHLHNHLMATQAPLLMTTAKAPEAMGLSLPDLLSRVAATTRATIDAPDDALLSAVLVKLLADRQLSPEPDAVRFLIPRIERSLAGMEALARDLDACALAHGRRITRPVAAEVLRDRGAPDANLP